MTSVFEGRADPAVPVTLTPQAASEGGEDSKGGGLDLSFFVSLGASLDSLAQSWRADRDEKDAVQPPADVPLYQAGTVPTTGPLILDLGSVPLGHVWQVRRLVVGGVSVTTPAVGAAYAFARGAPPTDLALSDCTDIFATLPQGNTYGTHQFFLVASEHLWVAFNGGSAGQQYAAAARIEDWEASSFHGGQHYSE